jgi:hypothetical protein
MRFPMSERGLHCRDADDQTGVLITLEDFGSVDW